MIAMSRKRGHIGGGLVMASLVLLIIAVAVPRLGDAFAGPLVREVALDQQPIGALVDERSGRVFVLTANGSSADPHGDGQVRVFDAASGALIHVENAGYRPCAIVDAGRAGHVFVAYSDATTVTGAVLMLDAATGALPRVSATGAARCGAAPVVDQRRGRVFFGGSDDSLSTLDAYSGQALYTVRLSGASGVSMVVDERSGRVFAAPADSGTVDVFDASNGRRLHTITLAGAHPPLSLLVDPRAGRLLVIDQTASTVSTVDTRANALLKVSSVAPSPAAWALDGEAAGGRLLVGGDSSVDILDTRTGAVVHTVTLGERATRILVDAATHHAFVLSADHLGPTNKVYVLDTRTGRLVTTLALPGVPLDAALDARHERLVVADQRGLIDILDTRTGRLIHALATVPSTMADVVIDAGAGRAFVLHGRGFVVIPDRWDWMPAWLRTRAPFVPRQSVSYQDAPAGVTIVDDTR